MSPITHNYNTVKQIYESIKPIRGRSTDIRPAGKRRRDWEQIVKTERGYAYRLHNTDCVEYTEDGKLLIRSGGWTTVGTGKFINDYAPLACGKRYNALWVGIDNTWTGNAVTHTSPKDRWLWVPIPKNGTVSFTWDSYRGSYVLDPVKIRTRVVNRKRANEARKRVKSLLDYCMTMLKLSDNGVRRELMYEVRHAAHEANILNLGEDMTPAFVHVLHRTQTYRVDWQRQTNYYSPASVKRTIYKMHDALSPEIFDYEWVEPSKQMPTNHVGYT